MVSIKEGVAAYKEKTKKLRKEQKRRKQHNDKFYPEKPKNDDYKLTELGGKARMMPEDFPNLSAEKMRERQKMLARAKEIADSAKKKKYGGAVMKARGGTFKGTF